MKSWSLLASLLPVSLALAAIPVKKGTNLPIIPNKFVVEVENVSDIPSRRSLDSTPHEALYRSLQERAITYEVGKEFNAPDLFVGAVLTLKSAQDVAEIASIPGVKAVQPVRKFERPKPVLWKAVSGVDDRAIPPDSESTHIVTGVDKVHAEGNTGKGIKIGIIDTGIDYTHPVLGGAFGPGHKVIGGFDFVGDAYTGDNTPVPDPDPLDQCAGHGTHVAGIIGADPSNPFNISGVAYDASISAYRIFGCEGFTSDEVIISALLRGVQDAQDILTLSLGGADGWTESSSAVVASRIARSGKIVTIAAGNDGASGSWYTSSPGNGIDVISTASTDNTVVPIQTVRVSGVEHAPIPYFELFPFPYPDPLPIYATSNSTTVVDDACNPLPPATPDLSGYVVIVRRGTCTFVTKLTNIAAKGAKVALIYDNGTGFNAISVGDFTAALIPKEDGEFLVSQYAAGAHITLSFPQSGGVIQYPNPEGGLVSSFTSYGPSNDFFFKPAIAAPGGSILSTLPLTQGAYGLASGTSMATPFLAGSAALLLAAKGKTVEVARNARTLFQSTATPVPSSHTDGDPLQTLTQQGAGQINVYNAIHTSTIVSPTELILNDTAHYRPLQTFIVKNTGKTAKEYTLTHLPAGTALTVEPGTIFPALGPVPLVNAPAGVTFVGGKTFKLAPGASRPVVAIFTPPKGQDASSFPVYSGFIKITSGSEITQVAYLGLAASLKNKQVVDNTDAVLGIPVPAILDAVGEPQTEPTNYTFAGGDFPSLLWRLTFGTPAFRVDLVTSNITFTPTLNKRAPRFWFPIPHNGGTFAKVKTVGSLLELNWIPRNDEGGSPYNLVDLVTPTFANGTEIPNGQYRILIRALKVTGNPTKEEDYESWLSPIVGVQKA